MQIKSLMNPALGTITPETTVLEAYQTVERQNTRALVVTVGDRVLGVVTNADVGRRVIADEKAAASKPVADVMSKRVAACFEDTEATQARTFMQQKKIQYILVCNRARQIVGLLSPEDLRNVQN